MMQQRLSSMFREGIPVFLGCKHLFFRILLLMLSVLLTSSFLYAEVTLDGTLGRSGSILGPNYGINADMGRQVGGNLFHSFGKFNIYTNESATFSGPGSIENVIARVTGGTSSWIDGRLRSEISGANLYLLNPAGVMFGPNASLDVSGSFHVTTADYLKLGQDGQFFATTPEKSSLTSAPPSAFGFLGSNPGKITIEASSNYLSVPAGRTLSVVGGDIQISAGGVLYAAGGRINLASVASPGEVTPESTGLNVSGFSQMGNITMTGGAWIYNSGTGGGDIYIRGGHFEIDGSYINTITEGGVDAGIIDIKTDALDITGGGQIWTATKGAGKGGNINVSAINSLTISGADRDGNMSLIAANANSSGSGGSIDIHAKTMKIENNGVIFTETRADGKAGSINITADSLDITSGAQIASNTRGSGKGGDINITAAESLNISGTAQDGGHSSGIFMDTFLEGGGDTGSINIKTDTLDMTGGAEISAATRGSGKGGAININASGSINISGTDQDGNKSSIAANAFSSGAGGNVDIQVKTIKMDNGGIQAATEGDGNAGRINIKADTLDMTGGAQIDSSTAYGNGNAGSIDINVDLLTIMGGSRIINRTRGNGSGGSITVRASDSISIFDEKSTGQTDISTKSGIYADAFGTGDSGTINIFTSLLNVTAGRIDTSTHGLGNGGNCNINVDKMIMSEGGLITSSTYPPYNPTGGYIRYGNGGSITISASDSVMLSGDDTWIWTSSYSHQYSYPIYGRAYGGDAGKITISAPSVSLTDGAKIFSEAMHFGEANAGDINIDVGKLSISGGAYISTDNYGEGKAGSISISASDSVTISGKKDYYNQTHIEGGHYTSFSGLSTNDAGWSWKEERGDGGTINIDTPVLMMNDEGRITAVTWGNKSAGVINIDVGSMVLANGASILSNTGSEGSGGKINIHSAGSITLSGNSTISAKSEREGDASREKLGNAGDITLAAGGTIQIENSMITTHALNADGGNIDIKTPNLLYLYRSAITTSVQGGAGNGGNIFIDPTFVVLNGSDIIANAYGGNGGNINIVSDYFLSSPDSKVEASSQLGVSGTVNITAPEVDISGGLTILPSTYLDLTSLLRDRCAAFADEKASSLVVTGQGGMPMEPDDYLMSP